jgi:hypothetical protein
MGRKNGKHPVVIGRRFLLKRKIDDSGVSGTGYVAFGVQWPSGKVTIEWLSDITSHEDHNNIDECMAVHGHGKHTVVEWIDSVELALKGDK